MILKNALFQYTKKSSNLKNNNFFKKRHFGSVFNPATDMPI